MERLFTLGLANAATATALAGVAVLLSYGLRERPGWRHVLWLMVLAKLISPPLFEVPVLRSPEFPAAGNTEAVGTTPIVVEATIVPIPAQPEVVNVVMEAPKPQLSPSPRTALGAIWLAGSACVLLLAGGRVARFRRLLRLAEPAPDEIQDQVADLAVSLDLARAPAVLMIEAPLPPLVWALMRKPQLVLPSALWKRLDARQRRLLLAHELAHLKRGDHLIRLFELAVTAAFWWLPTAWWARNALRGAEEECCDARVVRAFPDDARDYAETLLDTVDFLDDSGPALPVLASGFGRSPSLQLQRRLIMIMQGTTSRRPGLTGALGALGLSACLLPLTPVWAQTPAENSSSSSAITIQVKTDDEAKPGQEAKAEVNVGVTVDGELEQVKTDSVAKAIKALKQRVEALSKEEGEAGKHEAQIKALKQAISGLEKSSIGTVTFTKRDRAGEHATKTEEKRSVIVMRAEAGPKDQARIQKTKARISVLMQELQRKQKELAEAQKELAKLSGPQIVVGEAIPEIRFQAKPVEGRQFKGAGQEFKLEVREGHDPNRFEVRSLAPAIGVKEQDRIDALEKKLSRLLEEFEGLRKQREDAKPQAK